MRFAAGAGLSLGAALGMTATAQAADFTVTSLADDGGGAETTLREAITAADNGGGNDRVLFQSGLSGTITLAGQLPAVDEPLQIVGPGAKAVTVSGTPTSKIFDVLTPIGTDVTVSGLTLTGGTSVASGGGAIYDFHADLTIREVTITASEAADGGGIFAKGGSLAVEDSTLSGNTADSAAGIYLFASTATIRSSTLTGNHGDDGGAVRLAYGANLTIEDSTISGNTATFYGGGVMSTGGGDVTVRSSTISRNEVGASGGGIYTLNTNDFTLIDTVVADNTAGTGADLKGDVDAAFSLIESTGGGTINQTVPGSVITGVDPRLGPLADNGGPTRTQALLDGSPALDVGSSTGTDQRGAPRPFDLPGVPNSANGGDMGAYERVLCGGLLVNRVGDGGANRLTGTGGADGILGLGGADVLRGLAAGDALCGGPGPDRLIGGAGPDFLSGQGGGDLILGGNGRDRLLGGGGRDRLRGGPGRDRLKGGPGRDRQRQ